MNIAGKEYNTIWVKENDNSIIQVIDQSFLPFEFRIKELSSVEDVYTTIKDMHIRGAPLIGVAAAFGIYLALVKYDQNTPLNEYLLSAAEKLKSSRPTAINIKHAVDSQLEVINMYNTADEKRNAAFKNALKISETEKENCRLIGEFGLPVIKNISHQKKGSPVNILTHCNAGWLACIDYGTATAPIYMAHDSGINVHVWVDETRPRNQGARLTAWELEQHGVPFTIITDNAGGHIMQHGLVDIVIVGSDRTTITGDVANKIGTYLKALAANDNNIPFYVALPSSSIDWNIEDGINEIPIELRDSDEIKYIQGLINGKIKNVMITGDNFPARNFGFDVTPAKFVNGLITERGICKANKSSIISLFPEKFKNSDK
ncbi:MAG: S-methyl-5-thioribose-1-phosphate isomerase [Bacteroidales bacterium]|nr:MAG: S-methyl-5-thioribose-1-phosphate isomerase [Bacteroidales bacterium]